MHVIYKSTPVIKPQCGPVAGYPPILKSECVYRQSWKKGCSWKSWLCVAGRRVLGVRLRCGGPVWKSGSFRCAAPFPLLVENGGGLTSILKSSRLWYLPSIICACGWMGGRSMRNVEGQTAWFTQHRAWESLGKYLDWDQTDVMWHVLNTDL